MHAEIAPLVWVIGALIVAAFVCTIAAARDKCPLWVSVLLLCVASLLMIVPR